ncbi:MAG: hypothetical protein KGL39_60450, partial [Patescibacteria group bacterium]|nr:hypothetical protein [Patescibacteria group bacterium]
WAMSQTILGQTFAAAVAKLQATPPATVPAPFNTATQDDVVQFQALQAALGALPTGGEPPRFETNPATGFTNAGGGTFSILVSGSPDAAISVASNPSGVTLTDNGDSSALLTAPAGVTVGTYGLTLTATNTAGTAQQAFTLTVN